MVNNLSSLAEFINDDTLPSWLKHEIATNREAIFAELEKGQEVTIKGPKGEEITISPEPIAA
jgi:hypothetical protein